MSLNEISLNELINYLNFTLESLKYEHLEGGTRAKKLYAASVAMLSQLQAEVKTLKTDKGIANESYFSCLKEINHLKLIFNLGEVLNKRLKDENEYLKKQQEPNLFWNDDDPEQSQASINDVVVDVGSNDCLEVGSIITIQQAVRLPNIEVKVTSMSDEGDAEWERVK